MAARARNECVREGVRGQIDLAKGVSSAVEVPKAVAVGGQRFGTVTSKGIAQYARSGFAQSALYWRTRCGGVVAGVESARLGIGQALSITCRDVEPDDLRVLDRWRVLIDVSIFDGGV